ncbi:hypothetical protein HID58_034343 [Brassica napus]|uniref:Uncharacterized protein n=1 Tax=Brassica napus TaxID=3708 RepID=A0ABQ8C1T3_BRANA|nr:hypothetical protein HID58_034343 [Brassica napus]
MSLSVSKFSLNRVCRSSHGRWSRMISAASPYPSSQAIPTHSSRCSRHGKSPAQRWSMQEDGLIFYGRFHGEVNQENSGFRITEAVQRICVGDKAWIILQKQPVSNNNPVIMPLGSRLCPFFLRELRGSYLLLWLSLFYAKSKITRDVPFNESKAPRLKDFGNKKGEGHCI